MEQLIIINIDPNREQMIKIGKEPLPEIKTPEEAKEMVLTDIDWISKSLIKLIRVADESGYANKKDLIDKYTNSLSELLLEEISDEKKAIQKAELIIESCITNEQFDSASDFLGLYMKKYENQKIYDILMFSLTNKRKQING